MRWSKKAALELSINAIVVLILAITILGLGIAFIRGQFGALQEQFSSVSGEVKTELINKIKGSGDLLVFNRAEIDLQKGKKQSLFFGIKNNQNVKTCTFTTVKCIKALHPTTPVSGGITACAPGVAEGAIVGGAGCGSGCKKWFTVLTPIDIEGQDVGVFPMEIQISDAPSDTYLMEVSVLTPINTAGTPIPCSTQSLAVARLQPWALASPATSLIPTGPITTLQVLQTKQFTINLQ